MKTVDRILIVDDNDDIRKLLRLTLDNADIELLEARSGMEALQIVQRVHPRLVLLDIMMAGEIDGLEVCRKIKADPMLFDTRVILVTSRAQQSDIRAGYQAGADMYLIKPFSPLQLIDSIRQLATN